MSDGMTLFSLAFLEHVVDSLGWMLPVYLYLMSFLYTLFHELGHALMAVLLGTPVTRFQLGTPVLFRLQLAGLQLQFGPFLGGSVSYAYADDARRWKVALATLSGPLFPVLLSLPVFATAGLQPLTVMLGLILLVQTLANLNPFLRQADGHKVVMQLFMIMKGEKNLDS